MMLWKSLKLVAASSAIIAVISPISHAKPGVHKSVHDGFEDGTLGSIFVTFKRNHNAAAALNPSVLLTLCQSRYPEKLEKMAPDDFIRNVALFDHYRGMFVYDEIIKDHHRSKALLFSMAPHAIIETSIPISNAFLLKADREVFERLAQSDEVLQINTNRPFRPKLPGGPQRVENSRKLVKDSDGKTSILTHEEHKAKEDEESSSHHERSAGLATAYPIYTIDKPLWSIEKIGADKVWRMDPTFGAGKWITYASADTGVNFMHPLIENNYKGRIAPNTYVHDYAWFDGVRTRLNTQLISSCKAQSPMPCDDDGHGTHVMSTAVGGHGYGVAPDATWIACRNMDAGVGSTITYLTCLNFFLAPTDLNGNNPRPDLRPHVVGNSYTCTQEEECNPEAIAEAVKILRYSGIFMSVSAGNEGPDCGTVTQEPATEEMSITVGATDRNDALASFSSRGPVIQVPYIGTNGMSKSGLTRDKILRKPDIVAPGVGIKGAKASGGIMEQSGTSMAAPHVSGAAILIMAMCPTKSRDVDAVQALLEATAIPLPQPRQSKFARVFFGSPTIAQCGTDNEYTIPNNLYGYGRIDVLRAVNFCRPVKITL